MVIDGSLALTWPINPKAAVIAAGATEHRCAATFAGCLTATALTARATTVTASTETIAITLLHPQWKQQWTATWLGRAEVARLFTNHRIEALPDPLNAIAKNVERNALLRTGSRFATQQESQSNELLDRKLESRC